MQNWQSYISEVFDFESYRIEETEPWQDMVVSPVQKLLATPTDLIVKAFITKFGHIYQQYIKIYKISLQGELKYMASHTLTVLCDSRNCLYLSQSPEKLVWQEYRTSYFQLETKLEKQIKTCELKQTGNNSYIVFSRDEILRKKRRQRGQKLLTTNLSRILTKYQVICFMKRGRKTKGMTWNR